MFKKEIDIQNCKNYIYDKTFYNDKSFGRKKFDKIVIFLKKNNYSMFGDL